MSALWRHPHWRAFPLIGALLWFPIGAGAEDGTAIEARIWVITSWPGVCTGSQRNDWDNMVESWYGEITNDGDVPFGHGAGAWWAVGSQVNGTIVDSDFVDAGSYDWGNDDSAIDQSDAVMVGLHGIDDPEGDGWRGRVRFDEPGTGNCNAFQGHIELGDEDLEFLHLSSCFSMDRENWWPNWNSSFHGLHQIDGFHGITWIRSAYSTAFREFAHDAFWISISESWIDNLYIPNATNSHDQCPVSRNVGNSGSDSLNRMNKERYNHVYSDPPGPDSPRNHRVRYIKGCDPKGKGALPS